MFGAKTNSSVRVNHNETMVRDGEEIELDAEELEEVIAPGKRLNHNETLLRDASQVTK
jgi:hypothetical protein